MKMTWILGIILTLIATISALLLSYPAFAVDHGWPMGRAVNGPTVRIGSLLSLAAGVLLPFLYIGWWAPFVVAFIAWNLSGLIVLDLKHYTQLVGLLGIPLLWVVFFVVASQGAP